MRKNSLRLTLALMLIIIMLTGYGGLCKKSDDDVITGSSAPLPHVPGWGLPQLLETDDTDDALDPQIAFDPASNAIAVWRQNTGTGFYSIFANRYVSGTGWGTAELVETDDVSHALDPQIAFDSDGNAIAIWYHNTGAGFTSIFANRYVSGTGWGLPQLLETDDRDDAFNPQIAFDLQGNAIAVWSQDTSTGVYSLFANRYVSGIGWGVAQLLEADDTGTATDPQIAIDPAGNAIAVWSQVIGARISIFANRYVSGTGWGTAQLVETDDISHASDPQIAIDPAGNAIAVWRQNTGTTFYSIFANRYVSGTGWGLPQLLETDDAVNAYESQIAIDSAGNAIAIWRQITNEKWSIFTNRYVPGTGWGLPQLIETDDENSAENPQIAFDAEDNAIAVWHQVANTKYSIFANRYVSGTGWGLPQLIETDDIEIARYPQIAIDPVGNAIAVWQQDDGTRISIWANRFE